MYFYVHFLCYFGVINDDDYDSSESAIAKTMYYYPARRYCDPSCLLVGWLVRSFVDVFVSVFVC